jgi:hypothetical protein
MEAYPGINLSDPKIQDLVYVVSDLGKVVEEVEKISKYAEENTLIYNPNYNGVTTVNL